MSQTGGAKIDDQLIDAAADGDIVEVERTIRAGANVNKKYELGVSALYYAAYYGKLIVVERLIAAGANVNITKNDNVTPLYAASQKGHLEVVVRLLNAGANRTLRATDGTLPIDVAKTNEIRNLLENDYKIVGEEVFKNNKKVFLIRDGILYTIRDRESNNDYNEDEPWTFEHWQGPHANAADQKEFTEVMTTLGRITHVKKPLWEAAADGNNKEVTSLISVGADVNEVSPTDESTPLLKAAQNKHWEVVRLLINAGADANKPNKNGLIPLHFAAKYGTEYSCYLLANDDNINARTDTGVTPLHMAAQYNYSFIVKKLLEFGADKTIPDNKGLLPVDVTTDINIKELLKPDPRNIENVQKRKKITMDAIHKLKKPIGKVLEISDIHGVPGHIPNNIETIIIHPIGLTRLMVLPTSLKYLHCSNNPINTLPELPTSLKVLICAACGLNELPDLPKSLEYLDARNNNLHDIRKLPPKLFVAPMKRMNDPANYEESSPLLLSGNPIPLGLLNGYGSITQYSPDHIHDCINYKDETVCTMIIPKGTILFRDTETPYKQEEIKGIYAKKKYHMFPSFNVFFYPYPFVAESYINSKFMNVFETIRDIEVVMGVAPSHNSRADRFNDIYLTSCNNMNIPIPEFYGYDYDPCFTNDFATKYKNINGLFVLAKKDADIHIDNMSSQRFWSKYRTNHMDIKKSRESNDEDEGENGEISVGVPEIVLHPHSNRFDNKSPLNYKYVGHVKRDINSYDGSWKMVEDNLRTGIWTIDLFTKLYVNYNSASDEVKARCVPPEDPYKLYHLNQSYWTPPSLTGGYRTRTRRRCRRRRHHRGTLRRRINPARTSK